jgi:tetratricopeptide (TPR) repeat protein
VLSAFALMSLLAAQSGVQVALHEAERLEKAGDSAAALASYRQALAESKADTPERADALLGLANLESALGKYPEATGHARAAVTILEAHGDRARASAAWNSAGLASLYGGNYAEAEQALRAALALSTAIDAPPARAEQIGNLGNVQFFLGRYADAAREYDRALAVVDAHAAEPWAARRRRIILANQASLFQRLGRDQQALAVYRTLDSTANELRPREQAQLLVNLGVLYRRLGDPIKALETYDQARALFARDRNVDGELGVLKNRGIVQALDLKALPQAEQTFSEALTAATRVGNQREMLHAQLYRGEAILRQGDKARARADFSQALALATGLHTPEEVWKAGYGLGRSNPDAQAAVGELTQAIARIEQIRENIRVPSLRRDFLNDKREVYDALLAARLAEAPVAELFNILERSHSRGWRERLHLSASVDLASVQRALPDRTLLLDYWQSPIGSAVIAVTRTKAAMHRFEIAPAAIKTLIDGLSADPSSGWESARDAASALLPGAAWLDGIDHVIVVPDGTVSLVPFELLRVNGQSLVERAAVSYTPTAVTLLRPIETRQMWAPPWRLQLRAFGDPLVPSASFDVGEEVRGRLSGSADEVRTIAAQLAGRAELHLGADDRKAALLQRSSAPLLHLATHAVADINAMEQSRLLFSPAAGDAPADYLFLKEAYDLPLEDVELAVLSACDTERGQLVRGEGVQSFSRAFLAAGARSTVTTLWRVADRPTAELMRIFYRHLQRGLPRDEALRQAKLSFAQSGGALAHPHYWAAFVLTGEALQPIQRAVPWSWIPLSIGGVLLAAAAAVAMLRRARRRA